MVAKRIRVKGRGQLVAALIAVLLTTSCSSTRFVPEDRFLLNKVQLEVDSPEINKEEAKAFLRQKENYKILGFVKFYLLLYNLSSKKKTDDWLKRIGEPPQLYDEMLAERSNEQLKQYLDNKGYYRAQIDNDVAFRERKKKADLTFRIETGERYTIRNVRYHFQAPQLRNIFMADSANIALKPNAPFDIYELEKQQQKIVKLYRDRGYYFFSKNNVRYRADTIQYENEVILDLHIGETLNSQVDSAKVLRPWYFNKFFYSVISGDAANMSFEDAVVDFADTLSWYKSTLYLPKAIRYPPGLFIRSNQMEVEGLYNSNEVENTFNGLNRLRQFRYVDIQFKETYPDSTVDQLDCYIRLAPLNKQSVSLDLEGTNTSGNFGVAGNIYYQHRNLFRGAEVFQLRLKGATERMQRGLGDQSEYFNTREFGIETNLTIPKLLGPGRFINSFERNLPKTVINAGFNYQRRPEYTRTITSVKFGYDWKTTQHLSHLWNLLDINIVRLFEFDPEFINSIEDLYIKSSFTDHFIAAMNYSFVFNNQRLNVRENYTFLRFNVESSGNVLWALSKLTNQQKYYNPDFGLGYYEFLNTQYAQYLKADVEVRRAILIDKYNTVVGRAFVGAGFPFGNSRLLPFEKQYFAGGANGIRAWQVRSLGPGAYRADVNDYPNQSADFKLEANLEYRFSLFPKLEGAFFIDAGNIWAINKYDDRPGATFKIDQFYRQIAVGTGTGLRFDLSYFILRFDVGMKLHDPSAESEKRWIIGNRKITGSDFNLNFAIGYPF